MELKPDEIVLFYYVLYASNKMEGQVGIDLQLHKE